jgi:hypothetical protein
MRNFPIFLNIFKQTPRQYPERDDCFFSRPFKNAIIRKYKSLKFTTLSLCIAARGENGGKESDITVCACALSPNVPDLLILGSSSNLKLFQSTQERVSHSRKVSQIKLWSLI